MSECGWKDNEAELSVITAARVQLITFILSQ